MKHTDGEYNTLHAGLGAKGYDVVSYFTEAKAVLGSDRYATDYGGARWLFASAEHRDLFAADPEKYAPRFGAYCAWGVAQGKLFDVDPVNGWQIVDGRLYLNFNAQLNATFAKDAASFIATAARNWPALNR
jgi:hypothetical protein